MLARVAECQDSDGKHTLSVHWHHRSAVPEGTSWCVSEALHSFEEE